MEKLSRKLTLYLLITFVLVSCNSLVTQTVEVTRLVPQTIEVTRIVPQTVITTQAIRVTATTNPEPKNVVTTESQHYLDRGYYDGIVVITQYYTFLGHNLYEEAYQLLGPTAKKHSPDIDNYVYMARLSFKAVEIVTVEPCTVWSEQHGGPPRPDSDQSKCFAVEIRAWGEDGMSGSAVSGDLQLLFLTLVLENGEWKIDSFATALQQ